MYTSNFLANKLRTKSLSRESSIFASLPGGSQLSYRHLFENAEKTAALMVECGVMPGDRIAVQVGKSLAAIELYLGSLLSGAIFLPLNTDYTATELEYFLKDASPHVFVCDPLDEENLTTIANKAKVSSLLTLSADGKSGSLLSRRETMAPGFKVVPRRASDLAAILYTSGTTGRSKGAMLSHAALASNAETLVEHWQFTKNDRLIHALPIFHTHGLFVAINVTLCAGSSLYFLPQFDTDEIVALLPRATVLMGVPTFYVRLLQEKRLDRETAKKMRLFISGSAPLLAETHARWHERTGHAILERYGMTETNMNTSNPYNGERRPGTVGFPLPGVELKITNTETGEVLPNGAIGQINVRGPNVFSGYWQMPEKTAEELQSDGWFLTGDLGTKDEDGYISIVGRSKDLIISGGYNVYPKEVELVIDTHAHVTESAVIGIPHPEYGEAVVAIVVANTKTDISETDIKVLTKASLAGYKCPKSVFFVDQLPRNTMGKVQKAALRKTFSNAFE